MKENKSEIGNQSADKTGTKPESEYHTSVLLHESMEGIHIQPGGIYVDATFGGGGHSSELLKYLGKEGKLFAFDQDEDAAQNVLNDKRFALIAANFREMKRFLRMYNATAVDGILADLGVSSWQFDTAERGFSYRFDGPLDMRMNRQTKATAADVLNRYSAEQLQRVLGEYGEVRNAKTLANAIVQGRMEKRMETIADLLNVCEQNRMGEKHKYFAQVFQAIRIEVNDELESLKDFLKQSYEVLKPGGRLVVITFHSLEDRLVKNFMKNGSFEDEPEKDFYGNVRKKFKVITKKPIEADKQEQKENSRSRSAKLRVAEKI